MDEKIRDHEKMKLSAHNAYCVRCRETGDIIDKADSYEDAKKLLKEYESADKADDIYEENFYEIVRL